MNWYNFGPKPTVGERRAKAIRAFEKLKKKNGAALEPVIVEGQKIARTFWGQAWCDNLEAYRDFEYRLPRGRSYVRHRAVLDLKIKPGRIIAKVHGSSLYNIEINIKPLLAERWQHFKQRSAGQIASLIELLKGQLSDHVIRQIIDREQGLFPAPDEIDMRCSCPDWAGMCKHVAAAMYGVGHRLDAQPKLLFTLRKLDPAELIDHAARMDPVAIASGAQPTLDADQVADVFGIDIKQDTADTSARVPSSKTNRTQRKATPRKVSKKKTPTKKKSTKKKARTISASTRKTASRPARSNRSLKKKK